MTMLLGDDGTLDTVIVCSECGAEMRFNFDGATEEDESAEYPSALKQVAKDAREISGGKIKAHLRVAAKSHARHLAQTRAGQKAYDSFVEWAKEQAAEDHECEVSNER